MRKSSRSLGGGTDLVRIRHPGELVDVVAEFGVEEGGGKECEDRMNR